MTDHVQRQFNRQPQNYHLSYTQGSETKLWHAKDSQYPFNLFRSSYQPKFGMVVFSKRLDALARLAVVEAIRRDEQEAPQREVDRLKKEAQETRATEEKARLANKANFHP
jgi:hypothetical protein